MLIRNAMHENSSAEKFEAPPERELPATAHSQGERLAVALLMFAGYLLALAWWRGRGWLALLAGVVSFALAVLHYIVQLKWADTANGKNPYTRPTNIKR
jgi:hypothetical protein